MMTPCVPLTSGDGERMPRAGSPLRSVWRGWETPVLTGKTPVSDQCPGLDRHKTITRPPRRGLRVTAWALALGTGFSLMGHPRTSRADKTALTTAQTVELDDATRAAIAKGLAWLADQQAEDGAYGTLSHYGPHVGITGLAGMAFLSNGDTPNRGPYGANVARALRFVLAHGSESGLFAAETSHGPMYGHGFATLFVAEVDGMTHSPGVREALRRAIRLTVTTQNDEGGWRYQPVRADADISVTICQIMALRAARNVGVYVDKAVIEKAIEYVRASQNPDGGFRYMLSSGGSAFARSAAGVAALQYAGIYGGESVERGLEYIRRFRPPNEQTVGHYFYGHYYAAQAMFLAGERYWRDWWPAVREELLNKQTPEGYWRGQAGQEYGTAMALIILQMPNRLLPIFQK